jgi:hypothetical protein
MDLKEIKRLCPTANRKKARKRLRASFDYGGNQDEKLD